MRTKHRYSDLYALGTGTGGIFGGTQAMSLNGLYDPDISGTGHQPYAFDQMAGMYGNYRVMKIKYTVLFTTPGATADVLCCVSYGINNTSDFAGMTPSKPLEWPNAQNGPLTSYGQRQRMFEGTIDLPALFGVSRTTYEGGDAYTATTAANPSASARLYFGIASYSGVSSEACHAQVIIDYDVIWFNRFCVGQS